MFVPVWLIVLVVLFTVYLIWCCCQLSNRACDMAFDFDRYANRAYCAFNQIAEDTNPEEYAEIHPALYAAIVRVNDVAKKEIN